MGFTKYVRASEKKIFKIDQKSCMNVFFISCPMSFNGIHVVGYKEQIHAIATNIYVSPLHNERNAHNVIK